MELWCKAWRRWLWRLRRYRTPLQFRYSYAILARIHPLPLLGLAALCLRVPRRFPCILPPTPRQIMTYPPEAYMDETHPDIYDLRLIPLWRWRDTMQRSFYRLYEAMCAFDEPLIGYEMEYFWKRHPRWDPAALADPSQHGGDGGLKREDEWKGRGGSGVDAEQYAVLASLAEALVYSLNWRLELGLRRDGRHVDRLEDGGDEADYVPYQCPDWAVVAPRLETRLILHDYGDGAATGSSEFFERRNIQASAAALRTV